MAGRVLLYHLATHRLRLRFLLGWAAVSANLFLVAAPRQIPHPHSGPAQFGHHFRQSSKRGSCSIALRDWATHCGEVAIEEWKAAKICVDGGRSRRHMVF
jgi:hypothetical protein